LTKVSFPVATDAGLIEKRRITSIEFGLFYRRAAALSGDGRLILFIAFMVMTYFLRMGESRFRRGEPMRRPFTEGLK
jgi:hypothetical protein